MPERTLAELVALSGLPSRTIRYYVAEGLVPSPGKDGRASRYPESTLDRLRLIARLRDAHLPLAEIRTRLSGLTDDDAAALVATPPEPPVAGSAIDYIRSVLEPSAAQPLEAELPLSSALDMPAFLRRPSQFEPPGVDPASAVSQSWGRSQWERIPLGAGIELHVRRPLTRRENRTVERLIAFARQLQREDPL